MSKKEKEIWNDSSVKFIIIVSIKEISITHKIAIVFTQFPEAQFQQITYLLIGSRIKPTISVHFFFSAALIVVSNGCFY